MGFFTISSTHNTDPADITAERLVPITNTVTMGQAIVTMDFTQFNGDGLSASRFFAPAQYETTEDALNHIGAICARADAVLLTNNLHCDDSSNNTAANTATANTATTMQPGLSCHPAASALAHMLRNDTVQFINTTTDAEMFVLNRKLIRRLRDRITLTLDTCKADPRGILTAFPLDPRHSQFIADVDATALVLGLRQFEAALAKAEEQAADPGLAVFYVCVTQEHTPISSH